MSYCRFSSNDFQCDLYVYESTQGYEIHVASNRIQFVEPLPPLVSWSDTEAFLVRHNTVQDILKKSPHTDIGLPFDGKSYYCEDLLEFYGKMFELKKAGYRFPEHIFEVISEEAKGLEVYYYPMIGKQPHDEKSYKITSLAILNDQPLACLERKSGYVALEALEVA